MKKLLLCFAALVPVLQIGAQENTDTKPARFKPYNVHFMTGLSFYSDPPLSWEEMQRVAPGSQLMMTNFSNYESSPMWGYLNSTASFSALAEFVPYSKKKKDYLWYSTVRAGFIYRGVYVDGPSYWKQTTDRIDTVYTGNETYYVDSVRSKNYNFSWSGQTIGIDLSQVFHTNDQRLFSFWMGYGVQLSAAVNNYFYGSYNEMSYSATYAANNPNVKLTSDYIFDSKSEHIHTKSAFVGRLYFPIGIQLRLSRRENFLNKVALTLEMRPSMDVQTLPGLGRPLMHFYYNQNVGLKYYFHHGN